MPCIVQSDQKLDGHKENPVQLLHVRKFPISIIRNPVSVSANRLSWSTKMKIGVLSRLCVQLFLDKAAVAVPYQKQKECVMLSTIM